MYDRLNSFLEKTIISGYFLLFFLVPLFLTPYNFELFEYNKMMLVYGLTVIIIGSWIIKMLVLKKIIFKRTPFDLPLLLFLLSQIISTFLSIDRHVSIWGYYSRFNGGLLSTIAYLLLFYAFVSNFPREKIKNLLLAMTISGTLVASYAVLEHFGIDKNLWVQDVQNRVFSTLGQPNWLAAYLAILIPIATGLAISHQSQTQISKQSQISKEDPKSEKIANNSLFLVTLFYCFIAVYYLALLYTKSRSGFLGIWIVMIILGLILFVLQKVISSLQTPLTSAIAQLCGAGSKTTGFIIFIFLIITFFTGAPFQEINRFTFRELLSYPSASQNEPWTEKPSGGSVIEIGITESGTIRKIVWQGAVDIFKNYPLFGSGVETFAYSYFKFRPVEHNMTSEWDFLYNKAHNEYLNFAATSGAFGLGSYLLFIGTFILWNIKKLKAQSSKIKTTTPNSKVNSLKILDMDLSSEFLVLSLFIAWLTILITNFFGFSVVLVQLFFFLIPAISIILTNESDNRQLFDIVRPFNMNLFALKHLKGGPELVEGDSFQVKEFENLRIISIHNNKISIIQYLLILVISLVSFYLLFAIAKMWYADTLYAKGASQAKSQEFYQAYQTLKSAILNNQNEPVYFDEFVVPAAYLATRAFEQKQASLSSQLAKEATLASTQALTISPNNINFWKTRTRLYYTLADMDEKFLESAVASLEKARFLSPTDPKVTYNLALLYDKMEKSKEAIDLLQETTKLKPDYKDAYFALGLFYEREKKYDKAKEAYNFILTRLNPNDEEALKRVKELK